MGIGATFGSAPAESAANSGEISVSAVKWIATTAAQGHACAIRSDHTLWCWGGNGSGELGDGTGKDRYSPVRIGTAATWAKVSAGDRYTCATRADQSLWCWGSNDYGQLGNGTLTGHRSPVRVGTARAWVSVSAGEYHTCATRTDHTVWCWGRNDAGNIGDGTTTGRRSPVRVGTAKTWASVSVSSGIDSSQDLAETCATRTDHTLWCWGSNQNGQLGDGTTKNRRSPVRVGTAKTWASVSAGDGHTCATRTTGTLWCWGNNWHGQLGDGTTRERHAPVQVGSGKTWTNVSAGFDHSCATRADRTLWCWGNNDDGQLGLGTPAERHSPTRIGAVTIWAGLSAGFHHTCATRTDYTMWCWGNNESGQLGVAQCSHQWHPPLPSAWVRDDWTSVAAEQITRAQSALATPVVLGDNDYGQLGTPRHHQFLANPDRYGYGMGQRLRRWGQRLRDSHGSLPVVLGGQLVGAARAGKHHREAPAGTGGYRYELGERCHW